MKLRSQFLFLLALLFTLGFACPSFGQFRGGPGQTITCSSNNGRRNWCAIDTRGGVRMNRQLSGSPCIRDQTWGWDNRGVWVDRGCRAEFFVGGGNFGGPGRGRGQIVTCSSNDGRRNWCSIPPRSQVTISRQISGSPCVQGQTWGWDNRGLWVDRGCRAEFVVR